jgi:NADPH:quinone reductase
MRAIVFDSYGDPDVMRLRDVPVPEPQEGEVLIRVGYAGINPADSKTRAGHAARWGYRYVDFPFVIGMDAAGIVERTG